MRNTILRFHTDNRGNVALMLAAFVLVASVCIGLAVDYSRISSQKAKIDAASDAASLAALKSATNRPIKKGNGDLNVSATRAQAEKEAENVFKVALANDKSNMTVTPTFTIAYNASSSEWSSTVSYSAHVPAMFGGLVGRSTFDVAGKAVARESTGSTVYMDVQMLLDVSSSMGIGATDADIAKMVSLNGCAFGCHVPSYKATYYDLPKANGVKMRIDVLRESTQNLITLAKTASNGVGNISFGIDTFHDKVNTVVAMTSNLDSVSAAVTAIDLPTHEDATDIKGALLAMDTKMTSSGSGTSTATARKFLFIVTDGVEDQIYTTTANTFDTEEVAGAWGNTGSMRPKYCKPIKDKDVTVAVIYTTYVKFAGWQYTSLIQPFDSKIAKKLESCASDGFFWQATSAAEIDAAMTEMFTKSVKSVTARLTN